jgi:hypothetical protein
MVRPRTFGSLLSGHQRSLFSAGGATRTVKKTGAAPKKSGGKAMKGPKWHYKASAKAWKQKKRAQKRAANQAAGRGWKRKNTRRGAVKYVRKVGKKK